VILRLSAVTLAGLIGLALAQSKPSPSEAPSTQLAGTGDIEKDTVYLMDAPELDPGHSAQFLFRVKPQDHGGGCGGTLYYQERPRMIRRMLFTSEDYVSIPAGVRAVLLEPNCVKCAYALVPLNARPNERVVVDVKTEQATRLRITRALPDDADWHWRIYGTISSNVGEAGDPVPPDTEVLDAVTITTTDAAGKPKGLDAFHARPGIITPTSYTLVNASLSSRFPRSKTVRVDMLCDRWHLIQCAKATDEMTFTLPKENK
jgi:hypothetical protein